MSYSFEIGDMLPKRAPDGQPMGWSPAYLDGFGDARHAAAEIAAEADATIAELQREREEDQGVIRVWRGRAERADATIAELVAALEAVVAHSNGSRTSGYADLPWPTVEIARAALARVKGQA